nr:hypothetical protein [Marinicella sp. W31]MDC2877273.1 hypothetical protein [Marinicella sp. W31]
MDNVARFVSQTGETVTAFALGPLEAQYYPGAVTRGTDNVDYKFINGFVDVGELPCRTAVRAEIAGRNVALKDDFQIVSTNLPGFNRRLDFSGFWHRPTRLSRWVRTRLVPPKSGSFPSASRHAVVRTSLLMAKRLPRSSPIPATRHRKWNWSCRLQTAAPIW